MTRPNEVVKPQQARGVAHPQVAAPRTVVAPVPPPVTGQGAAAAIGAAMTSRIPVVAGSRIGHVIGQLQAGKRQREEDEKVQRANDAMKEVRELKKMRMVSGSGPVQEDKKLPQAVKKKSPKGKGKEKASGPPAFMKTFGQTTKAAVPPRPPTVNPLKRPLDGAQNQALLKRPKLVHSQAVSSVAGARKLVWKENSQIAGPSRPRPPLPAAFGKRAGIPTQFKQRIAARAPSRGEGIVLESPNSE